jgi:membrane protein
VFPQIHSLPGSQHQLSLADWNVFRRVCERATDVRRHVVGPFVVVLPAPLFGHELAEVTFEITQYRGIGVLLDEQTCRGVANEHGEKPGLHARRRHNLVQSRSKVGKPFSGAANVQVLLVDNHGCASVLRSTYLMSDFEPSPLSEQSRSRESSSDSQEDPQPEPQSQRGRIDTWKFNSKSSWEAFQHRLHLWSNKGPFERMVATIIRNLDRHHCTQLASAMAFDLFLALIPALALAGWALSVVLKDDTTALVNVSAWLDVAPHAVHELVNQHAERFSGLTLAPIALCGAVWLASGAFYTVMEAFDRTVSKSPRMWWVRRLMAIACVVCVMVAAVLGTWVTVRLAGGPALLLHLLPNSEGFERVLIAVDGPKLVGLAASGIMITLLIAGFFRIGVRRDVPVRRVWYGTSTTVMLAAIASYGFAIYARTIARFAFYYGSLAAVAVLLAWLWLCSFALLLLP